MENKKRQFLGGSITIGLIASIGVPLFLAGVGYIFSLSSKHNSDVKDINAELRDKGEQISAIREAVDTIKDDNKTIKEDVKKILEKLK